MRRLQIFDTTLRDGEQSLGITLNVIEKLEIAKQLVKLGVDVIEVGFPASSPGDFLSVQTISKELKGVIACGLTRCNEQDIDRCIEAIKGAEAPRIHTGIAVSPVHMEKKLRMSPEEVLHTVSVAVRHAKRHISDVEFYAEDAFRSERDFLVKVLTTAIEAGATVVNIPDTVGYATPWEYGDLISYVYKNVKNIDKVTVSVHCHNDLGMATANSLAGIMAGATQIEGTINGIGERAGNTALEEVIMAIYTQKQSNGIYCAINTREIAATSRLVSRITGVPVPSHKAIVGANAFMHASGIHQDGVLKEKLTYEIIDPEIIGVPRNNIVLSARSGRHALKHRLEELGYTLSKQDVDAIYHEFLVLADQKKEVYDEDLHSLMGTAVSIDNPIKLKSVAVSTTGVSSATATIALEWQGEILSDAATGNGPVDAVFQAIERIVGSKAKLEDYSIKSVSKGTEALGEAIVKLSVGAGASVVGNGISTDVIEASAKAYVNALSKLNLNRQQ